jgi:hypothetical protein
MSLITNGLQFWSLIGFLRYFLVVFPFFYSNYCFSILKTFFTTFLALLRFTLLLKRAV